MRGLYRWAVVFAGMTMLGCAERVKATLALKVITASSVPPPQWTSPPQNTASPRRISSSSVRGIKELEFTTTIRPDGKIQLNLLGEMYVAGKTPDEISRMITAAAAKYYNNPGVQVEVAEFNSKFYAVFGTAVREGGRRPFTGRNTVIAALASAGFTEDAWPQQIAISRPAKNGQIRATAIIDMKTMYMTGDTRQNYLLEEGDIIHVPDSPLAVFEKKARQVLGPITGIGGAATSAASYGTAPK